MPEKCKIFSPGDDAMDLQSRVGRLEKLCESYLPAILDKLEEREEEEAQERQRRRERDERESAERAAAAASAAAAAAAAAARSSTIPPPPAQAPGGSAGVRPPYGSPGSLYQANYGQFRYGPAAVSPGPGAWAEHRERTASQQQNGGGGAAAAPSPPAGAAGAPRPSRPGSSSGTGAAPSLPSSSRLPPLPAYPGLAATYGRQASGYGAASGASTSPYASSAAATAALAPPPLPLPSGPGSGAAAGAVAGENDATNVEGRLDPKTGSFLGSGAVSMRIHRLLDSLPSSSSHSSSGGAKGGKASTPSGAGAAAAGGTSPLPHGLLSRSNSGVGAGVQSPGAGGYRKENVESLRHHQQQSEERGEAGGQAGAAREQSGAPAGAADAMDTDEGAAAGGKSGDAATGSNTETQAGGDAANDAQDAGPAGAQESAQAAGASGSRRSSTASRGERESSSGSSKQDAAAGEDNEGKSRTNVLSAALGSGGATGSSSIASADEAIEVGEPVRTIENAPLELEDALGEFGVPEGEVSQLLGELPSQLLARKLTEHVFGDINWIRSPLPRKYLLKLFDEFWQSGPKLTITNLNVFAILMSSCALGATSLPDKAFEQANQDELDPGRAAKAIRCGSKGRMALARRYNYLAHRALLASSTLGIEDLNHVIAWVQSTKFLFLDRRISEAFVAAGSAAKAAFSLGLHRDGLRFGLSHQETALRRNVWSCVYYADKTLALNLGRPTGILDSVCDTQAPYDEELEEEFPHPVKDAPPGVLPGGVSAPTCLTYTTVRFQLGAIMSRVVDIYQEVHRPAHYKDVLDIDQHLEAVRHNMPFYFRCKLNNADQIEVDTRLDDAFPFIPVHRFLIEAEINFLRMALHRPFLLRSAGSQGGRYMPSRKACLKAAHLDIRLRDYFIRYLEEKHSPEQVPLHFRVHLGTYKWFNSLLICGILLLIDPHSSSTPQLKVHLVNWIAQADKLKAAGIVKDDIREREAAILRLFLTRVEQLQKHGKSRSSRKRQRAAEAEAQGGAAKRAALEASAAKAADAAPGDDHANADLLLGLGQQARDSAAPTPQTNNREMVSPSATAAAGLADTPSLQSMSDHLPSPIVQSENAQHLFDAWYRAEMVSGGSVLDNAFGQHAPPTQATIVNGSAQPPQPWLPQPQWIDANHASQPYAEAPTPLPIVMPTNADTPGGGMTPYLQAVRNTATVPSADLGDAIEPPTDAGGDPQQFWQR